MAPCKYLITLNKLIGIILVSMGVGMLIVSIISWWAYIIAVIILVLGLLLIYSK